MATYKEIQDHVKGHNKGGKGVGSCAIAHVKEMHKLVPVNADRKNKCPKSRITEIESALRHFKMIP